MARFEGLEKPLFCIVGVGFVHVFFGSADIFVHGKSGVSLLTHAPEFLWSISSIYNGRLNSSCPPIFEPGNRSSTSAFAPSAHSSTWSHFWQLASVLKYGNGFSCPWSQL